MKLKSQNLYTASEAAKILKCNARWIRKLCEEDRIGFLLGNRWVITKKEIQSYKETGKPPKVRSNV